MSFDPEVGAAMSHPAVLSVIAVKNGGNLAAKSHNEKTKTELEALILMRQMLSER